MGFFLTNIFSFSIDLVHSSHAQLEVAFCNLKSTHIENDLEAIAMHLRQTNQTDLAIEK